MSSPEFFEILINESPTVFNEISTSYEIPSKELFGRFIANKINVKIPKKINEPVNNINFKKQKSFYL